MIEKIREYVKKEADEDDWKYHIVPVVNYAKKLAKILKADIEITELAALLHDIGRIKFGTKNHDLTGAVEAEKILKKAGYSQKVIDEVKHSVESHRGSKNIPPKTIIARIVANADAMAHFDVIPMLFYWRAKDGTFEEGFKWVLEKIERDWNKKLTISEAKEMMKEKYKAIKVVLEANKDYI